MASPRASSAPRVPSENVLRGKRPPPEMIEKKKKETFKKLHACYRCYRYRHPLQRPNVVRQHGANHPAARKWVRACGGSRDCALCWLLTAARRFVTGVGM